MTALTREQLLDIDPLQGDEPYIIALRHAWNWAVEAETEGEPLECAAVSQAWSAIAEALK